jgi:peptide-methionine (S)-S-oxide reductase
VDIVTEIPALPVVVLHVVARHAPTHPRCDGGSDYRTIIFTHGAAQNAAALRSRAALDSSGHFTVPVVTEVVADAPFWRAEEYHQHFADRNPVRYALYRQGCGRDARLHELWGNAASPYVPAH